MRASLLPWLLPLAAAWTWFCTLRAVAYTRIAGLATVENYAFAVYDQLIWTYAHTGRWAQTIHFGYVDHWMWSGHRSLLLFPVAALYGLAPGPFTLAQLQIGVVALGAVPAYGLGRRTIAGKGLWGEIGGGLLGVLVYLGFPPLAVVALNDYQDLVLGVPFALAAAWAARSGSAVGFAIAAIGACAAREEWIPVVAALGLGVPGGWRARLPWLLGGVVIAAAWTGLLAWLGRDFSGYGNQMVAQARGLDLHGWHVTRSAADWDRFYRFLLFPVQWLGLLAPGAALPALATVGVHLTTPPNGGIDTVWTRHVHHVAPTCALLVVATLQGASTVARLVRVRAEGWRVLVRAEPPATPAWLVWVGVVAVGAAVVANAPPWTTAMGATPRFGLALPAVPEAPVRALVRQVPPDASVATDTAASLAVSSRRFAYTYDESLRDKAPAKGLRAVDWLIVRDRDTDWIAQAEEAGATRVDDAGGYVLYRMPWAR